MGIIYSATRSRCTWTKGRNIEIKIPEGTPSCKTQNKSCHPDTVSTDCAYLLAVTFCTECCFSGAQTKPRYSNIIVLSTRLFCVFFLDIFTLQLFQNGQSHHPQASFHQTCFSFTRQSLPLLSVGFIFWRQYWMLQVIWLQRSFGREIYTFMAFYLYSDCYFTFQIMNLPVTRVDSITHFKWKPNFPP